MAIRCVGVIGATGKLGSSIVEALRSSESFQVTVLARSSSKSPIPAASQTVRIPDNATEGDLVAALQGQDALVVAMKASDERDVIRLADACIKAGVRRLIPPDFGSVDSLDPRCVELVPLYKQKNRVREHITQLSAQHPQFSWTSLVCGHFFDYGLSSGLLQFDLDTLQARIFDNGEVRWSASTFAQVGGAVVKVLQKEDQTRNKVLYIQSLCVSQKEVLATLERVSGRQFVATFVESESSIKTEKQKMDDGDGNAVEELVSVLGITRPNWENKLANELLGLSPADLQDCVARVWNSVG